MMETSKQKKGFKHESEKNRGQAKLNEDKEGVILQE